MSELNIYQRLSKITEELGFVSKDMQVGNQYKAVSEGAVLSAVKPAEFKNGVYSYPLTREVIFQEVLEEDKGTYKKTTFFMRVKTTYRFVNTDKPTEFVDIDTFGDGVDSLDKAPGKAMTYADKYALLKAYKIQTGDDPDAKHSDDVKVTRKQEKPQAPKDDISITYKKLLDLKLTAEQVTKWQDYYKVTSLFDLGQMEMQFIIDRFNKALK